MKNETRWLFFMGFSLAMTLLNVCTFVMRWFSGDENKAEMLFLLLMGLGAMICIWAVTPCTKKWFCAPIDSNW